MADAAFCFVLRVPPRLVRAGEGVEALLGYAPEDFLTGRVQLQERIHPEDAGLAEWLFSDANPDGRGTLNLRIRHADGRIRCCKARYERKRAREGPAQLELFLEDARQVAEPGDAGLVASFKSLIEHTGDYIQLKNRNHVILAVSGSAPLLSESAKSTAELVGKTDYDMHPEAVADVAYRMEAKSLCEGRRVDQLQKLRTREGRQIWIDNRKYPINGASGEIIGILGIAPEITEYLEAEERLRESEETLRQAQSIAGLGSYVLDLGSGLWTSSDVMDEIFGIGPDYERSIAGWGKLVQAEDREAASAYFRDEVIGQGKPFNREYRIVRPSDGAERWVHGMGRLSFDAEGRPVRMQGIVQDITAAKQAESALSASKELLRLFIEHAPVALAMFDREMRYLAASQRWLDEYVPGRPEIIGCSHYEIIPDIPERWREAHRRGLAGETLRNDEDRFMRADGSLEWIRWIVIPWRNAEGAVGGIILFAEDMTAWKRAQLEIAESKEFLRLFIEHAPAALAMLDREMRYVAVSRRWMEMHSMGDADVIGRSHYDIYPEIPESWREEHRRCLAGEKLDADERMLVRADGRAQWMRREILPWRSADGAIGGIVLFSEDVTERRATEERLRLAATVFTGAREGILITDPKGTILEVNEAFTRITGYSRQEVRGQNPRVLQSGLQSADFYKNMWDCLVRDGLWSGEVWNRTKSGDIYPETLNIHGIRDAAGQIKQYVGLFTDITDVKKHEQQLELAVHYDALTGLPNRALLADRLRQAMAQSHRRDQLLGVACFDLDGFKAVNDRYGHASGDALLTAVALRMKQFLREGDTLARLGGDEFVAVFLDLPNFDTCLTTLSRMLTVAADEVQVGDVALRVTASAGVAFYPQAEDVDADMLLRQAGQALYEAKLAGKNRYSIFDPGQDLMVRSRHENIEHVRRALAAHELVLYYQPKVNMRTGKVIGAEALLRWQHPERGLLPPGMFLPVIEDHPLTVEVGQWVIDSALAQMEIWQENGLELPVSVNVSAFELQQRDFVGNLCALLEAHPRVKPANLELEVLETSALQNVTLSSQVLAACRDAGVLISVDDFGTGYSSLAYLKRLPASILKIDQSFVRDMLDEPENLTILKGILGLAEAFRRQVIAEGVETVDHGLMLLQLGCDCAQGYGIARPMPAGDVPSWAAAWQPDERWADVPVIQATNRAALFAMAEHRAWYGHFLACLQETRSTAPFLDPHQCNFGAWLDTQRLAPGGMSPSFQAIDALHEQIHELAAEIYAAHVGGRKQDALGLLRQLRYLHERCLKRLQPFTRVSPRKSPGNVPLREHFSTAGAREA